MGHFARVPLSQVQPFPSTLVPRSKRRREVFGASREDVCVVVAGKE